MTIMPSVINLDMYYRFTLLKGSKKNVCPSFQKKTLIEFIRRAFDLTNHN